MKNFYIIFSILSLISCINANNSVQSKNMLANAINNQSNALLLTTCSAGCTILIIIGIVIGVIIIFGSLFIILLKNGKITVDMLPLKLVDILPPIIFPTRRINNLSDESFVGMSMVAMKSKSKSGNVGNSEFSSIQHAQDANIRKVSDLDLTNPRVIDKDTKKITLSNDIGGTVSKSDKSVSSTSSDLSLNNPSVKSVDDKSNIKLNKTRLSVPNKKK